MEILETPNGLTVAELKEYLKDLPEKTFDGRPQEVWFGSPGGKVRKCRAIWPLDRSGGGHGIMFGVGDKVE